VVPAWGRSCLPLALAAALILPLTLPLPALGQGAQDFMRLPDTKRGIPMLVQADQMIYDNDADSVTATGNVEIYYDKFALTADKVTYSKRNDTVTAAGNVRLKEPDGNVVFAETMSITGNFREGFVRSLSVLTPDKARIAAASARRIHGNVVLFNKAVYTACAVDPNLPEKEPIWQIKAVTVKHNQAEKTIEYKDVTFEFDGVPVAYMPSFSHADPSVRRKTGFLTPVFNNSSQLGFSVETPYFWALAPNYDLTFSPRMTTKQGLLMKAEWRHRLENGSYFVRGAGISQADPASLPAPGNTRWRGALETAGTFRINNNWTTGWNVVAASDDTFLRVYDLDRSTELVSNVFLTGQSERNYFNLSAMHLKNVATPPPLINRATGTAFTHPVTGAALPLGTPLNAAGTAPYIDPITGLPLSAPDQALVHPVLDYNYLFDNKVMGGQLALNVSAFSLTRDHGADSSRMISQFSWRRTFTDRFGQRITPFFSARGDIYHVNDVFDPAAFRGQRAEESVARGMATAGVEYSYPFISVHEWGHQVIEPIAQVILRPDEQAAKAIPNEDARSLVFDDTLLFDIDKFSGYDRVEGGSRANLGIRYTMQTNDWGHGTVLLGQSFHLGGTNPFAATTGLATQQSDWVGAIYLEPVDYFGVSTQFRLDNGTMSLRRHELRGWARVGPAYGSLTYAQDLMPSAPGVVGEREEIYGAGALNVTDKWRLFGKARYDIAGSQWVQSGIGIGYFCDCMNVRVDYTEDFFRDRDDRPNRTISLQVELKTLGGGSFGTDANDLSKSP